MAPPTTPAEPLIIPGISPEQIVVEPVAVIVPTVVIAFSTMVSDAVAVHPPPPVTITSIRFASEILPAGAV